MSIQSSQSFSLTVLSSFENLQQFLNGSKAYEQLATEKADPHISFYGQRQSYCNLLIRPSLHIISSCFHKITKHASYIGATSVSHYAKSLRNRAMIAEAYQIPRQPPLPKNDKKPFLIIRSLNLPALGTEDITSHPPIYHKNIPSGLKGLDLTNKSFTLDCPDGVCGGMSEWFLNLYLRTNDLGFNTARNHMIALGKLFTYGAPNEAVLLQHLKIVTGEILNMSIDINAAESISIINENGIMKIRNKYSAITQIERLPPGSYLVSTGNHACAYIKLNKELSFFFDPNFGVYEIDGLSQGEKIITLFDPDYLVKNEEITFRLCQPLSTFSKKLDPSENVLRDKGEDCHMQ